MVALDGQWKPLVVVWDFGLGWDFGIGQEQELHWTGFHIAGTGIEHEVVDFEIEKNK